MLARSEEARPPIRSLASAVGCGGLSRMLRGRGRRGRRSTSEHLDGNPSGELHDNGNRDLRGNRALSFGHNHSDLAAGVTFGEFFHKYGDRLITKFISWEFFRL